MYKIANIIYDRDLVNHDRVNYINYINDQISFKRLDSNLPTLYVGRKYLKTCNLNDNLIQKQSILVKKIITNLLYWEFSFEENKSQHVSGVKLFVLNSPYYFFSTNFNYVNIDPVFFKISNIHELLNYIPITIDCCYIHKNEMIYILYENNITGIDMNMYKFFDFDVDNIVEKIKNNTNNFFNDIDGKLFDKYNKIFTDFDFVKRYLVVMLSKS